MPDRPLRLGDVLDDYCPRCRLLLNHDVVTINDGKACKVTCRTCFNTHDYRNAQIPVRRKNKQELEAKTLIDQVLAAMPAPPSPPAAPPPTTPTLRKRRDLWAEYARVKKK
jgi:hypothetical protein